MLQNLILAVSLFKIPACRWLIFIVPKGAMQDAGGENVINGHTQQWTLHATILTCRARRVHGCNSGMTVLELTNGFLIGFEARITGRNSCLALYTS